VWRKIAFANDFRQIIDLRRIKFYHVNVELIVSDNMLKNSLHSIIIEFSCLTSKCFNVESLWYNSFEHIKMFSYRTFHDTFYRQFEHFVIHFVDECINTLFTHEKINELNHRFIVRRIRSSNNTISLKKISWKKSLICSFQYKKNMMIMISQIIKLIVE
jgi:hypothetical protein